MKKRFSFLTSVVALILAIFMISGCSFIINSSGTKYGVYTDNDSLLAAQSVNFNTTEKSRDIEDAFVDAVDAVKRTSVMITTASGGAGSGVIVDMSFIDSDDNAAAWKTNADMVYIITCHHMVSKSNSFGTEGIGEIEVAIPDENCSYYNPDYIFYGYIGSEKPSVYNNGYNGVKYAITLVGGDFESDIAVLKLDLSVAAKSGKKLSADKIEKAQIPDNTYSTKLGETVFSVGNPTGTLPGSVARGIVSYLARETAVSEVGNMTLMQIDVSTNPGNSGGGLYNLYGELIGITNAGNTDYTNINFAIPCYLKSGNGFVEIATQLCGTATDTNYGYVSGRKVKFGFSVVAESDDNGNSYVYVSSVTSGSLASKAKLQQGDKILSIEVKRGEEIIVSENISTVSDFGTIMDGLIAGDNITLNVSRTITTGWRVTTQTKQITMLTESFRFCNTNE